MAFEGLKIISMMVYGIRKSHRRDTTVFKFQIIKENWFIKVFLGEISKIMLIEP